MYIKSLNWGYKTQLKTKKVTYENAYGSFVGAHKIKVVLIYKCQHDGFNVEFLGHIAYWNKTHITYFCSV